MKTKFLNNLVLILAIIGVVIISGCVQQEKKIQTKKETTNVQRTIQEFIVTSCGDGGPSCHEINITVHGLGWSEGPFRVLYASGKEPWPIGGPTGWALPITFPTYSPKKACDDMSGSVPEQLATGLLEKILEVFGATLEVDWDSVNVDWSNICAMGVSFNKLWGYRVYVLSEADYKKYNGDWREAVNATIKNRPVIFDFSVRHSDTQTSDVFKQIERTVAAIPVDPADAQKEPDGKWRARYYFQVYPLVANHKDYSWTPFSMQLGTYEGDYQLGFINIWRYEQSNGGLRIRSEEVAVMGGDYLYNQARNRCSQSSRYGGCNWYVSHGSQALEVDGHDRYYPPAPDERMEIMAALEGGLEVTWDENAIPFCQRVGSCVTVKSTDPAAVIFYDKEEYPFVCGESNWCASADPNNTISSISPIYVRFSEPIEKNQNYTGEIALISDTARGPVDVITEINGDTLKIIPKKPVYNPTSSNTLRISPGSLQSKALYNGSLLGRFINPFKYIFI